MAAPENAKMILFAYTVNDYEKTAAFYKEALGVEFHGIGNGRGQGRFHGGLAFTFEMCPGA